MHQSRQYQFSRRSYGSHLFNEICPSFLGCLWSEKLSKNYGSFFYGHPVQYFSHFKPIGCLRKYLKNTLYVSILVKIMAISQPKIQKRRLFATFGQFFPIHTFCPCHTFLFCFGWVWTNSCLGVLFRGHILDKNWYLCLKWPLTLIRGRAKWPESNLYDYFSATECQDPGGPFIGKGPPKSASQGQF